MSRSTERQAPIREHLLREGRRADFFALIAALERLSPQSPPLGGDGPAGLEGVRLRHDPSLALRRSDVSAIELDERGRWQVTSAFLGLTGAVSPLPLYLCEEVVQAESERLQDFYDIFHHRLLSLFYRLVIGQRWPLTYQRDAADRWSRRVLALAGLESPISRISAPLRLRLAAIRINQRGTPHALRAALHAVLGEALAGAEIRVQPFVPERVEIDESQRARLGRGRLGDGSMLGATMLSVSSKVRLTIGPLPASSFRRFLPGGDLLPSIDETFAAIVDLPLDYDLELVLPAGTTPPLRLGGGRPSSLGRTTWLAGRSTRDTHVIVNPRRAAPRRI